MTNRPLMRLWQHISGERGKKGRQAGAARLREAADTARNDRKWLDAAAAYARYLELCPADFAIWVQLGHAAKEGKDFGWAEGAYRKALRLRPRDADLLLNMGHLAKLQGKLAEAADFYARSFRNDGNPHAKSELSAPSLARHLTDEHRSLLNRHRTHALKALQPYCQGLVIVDVGNLAVNSTTIEFLSSDPWVQFVVDATVVEASTMVDLTVSIEMETGDGTAGRLYIDYGSGFSERDSIALDQAENSILLAFPHLIGSLRWDPSESPGKASRLRAAVRPVTDIAAFEARLPDDIEPDARERAKALASRLLDWGSAPPPNPMALNRILSPHKFDPGFDYDYWLSRYDTPREADYLVMRDMIAEMAYKPTFSFIVPAFQTPPDLLIECIESLFAQNYPFFEICAVDDHSPDEQVSRILRDYEERFPNFRYIRRSFNGHISAASNDALALASNDFVVLVDHDDLIPDYALFVVSYYINRFPDGMVFFSDEDKVDIFGFRSDPYFKGNFNKFLMYGHNMVSHLGVYRRDLLEDIGGFRLGFEGSQDYDLALRALDRCGEKSIIHIPHVLYHWRTTPGSTSISADQKSYAVEAARAAINSHFDRMRIPLRSTQGFAPGVTAVSATREYADKISIIIPTKDRLDLLEPCLASIDRSRNVRSEIIIIDNQSTERATADYLGSLKRRSDISVMTYPYDFNFSAINNDAAKLATGEILCFLNNDTEIISPGWLDRARALLAIPEVGAVGARLLYEDGTLQHFGIGLGMAEHRVAATPHAGRAADDPGYFGKARLIQEFSAVTAACLFVRKADFESIGGFDPLLRVAYNDVDLCLRLRQAGFKILCDPEILLIHKESKTRGYDDGGERAERLDREAELMRRRWGDILDNDPYLSPNLALDRVDFALAYPPRVRLPWVGRA